MDYDYKNDISEIWWRSTLQKRQCLLIKIGCFHLSYAYKGFELLPQDIQDRLLTLEK